MYNSFQIFTPQKKFRLTTNQIFYPSFIFLLFLYFEIKTQPYHFFFIYSVSDFYLFKWI